MSRVPVVGRHAAAVLGGNGTVFRVWRGVLLFTGPAMLYISYLPGRMEAYIRPQEGRSRAWQ